MIVTSRFVVTTITEPGTGSKVRRRALGVRQVFAHTHFVRECVKSPANRVAVTSR